MDICTITQIDTKEHNIILHVNGRVISLRKTKNTEHIKNNQKIIMLYSNTDHRLLACICGWRIYFLNDPLRMHAHQTNYIPTTNQFAGIRHNSFDKMVYRLFRFNKRCAQKTRK